MQSFTQVGANAAELVRPKRKSKPGRQQNVMLDAKRIVPGQLDGNLPKALGALLKLA